MVLIWTLGEIISSPVASAFVADRSPEHTRGRYQASLGVMFALGAIVGPTLGTLAYDLQPGSPVDLVRRRRRAGGRARPGSGPPSRPGPGG